MRKFTHKKLIKITMSREQIRMVEDEWYTRFNKNHNVNTNIVG